MRAVENHGIRPVPIRLRHKYSPENERYHKEARFLSIYYDAPVNTKVELEKRMKVVEAVMRVHTLRTPSIVDEVEKQI